MDEKNRIEKVIEYLGLNSGQFASEIDITAPALSHILNGRNNPSLDVMKKILERYPEINSDWLILGKGSMLRKISNSQTPSLFDDIDLNNSISEDYSIKNKDIKESSKITKENKIVQDDKFSSGTSIETTMLPRTITVSKKIERIIIYFDDNTFQEFK